MTATVHSVTRRRSTRCVLTTLVCRHAAAASFLVRLAGGAVGRSRATSAYTRDHTPGFRRDQLANNRAGTPLRSARQQQTPLIAPQLAGRQAVVINDLLARLLVLTWPGPIH